MKKVQTVALVAVVAVVFFIAGVFSAPVINPPPRRTLLDMTFAVNWVFDGEHPAFFVALDKGFYRENGLNVKIVRGFGGADTVKRVATGEVPMGMGDAVSAILSNARGLPVKIVAVYFDRAPFAFHALVESGIDHPRKLAGKTAAAPPGDVQRAAWPLLAKAVGIDPNSLTWVNVEAAAKIVSLCERKVDATPFFYDAVETLWRACGGKDKVITMPYWKYGVDIYGMVIVVNPDFLNKHPEAVKGFLDALFKATQWSIQNPDEAIKIMRDYQPQLDFELTKSQWIIEITTMQTDRIKNNYLGYIDDDQMRKTIKAVSEAYNVPEVKLEDVVAKGFLPQYKLPEVNYPVPDFLKP
ncbi:MAG: ABC transporter substrate-binding protein [Candidatus Woesearchaeota archaeon]